MKHQDSPKFNFGNNAVAKAYDSILVPVLFEPWAKALVEEHQPLLGKNVLELACGTGVVTKELANYVLPNGSITALDINKEMLSLAKEKCERWSSKINFIEGSADALALSDEKVDLVICQQGFQFFPNKRIAASEIYRVLKKGGKATITTWCEVSKCQIFDAVCKSLESLGHHEISQTMRVPFDHLSGDELLKVFENQSFSNIKVIEKSKKLYLENGTSDVIRFAYATPIGPMLNKLSLEVQEQFQQLLLERVSKLSEEDSSMGVMTSYVLTAEK